MGRADRAAHGRQERPERSEDHLNGPQAPPSGGPALQLAYALLVSDDVFNYVRQVQLEILERFDHSPELRLPPHITVKLPFETSVDLRVFERYLDVLASDVESFEVVIRGFGVFDEGILFLDLDQDRRLAALQRRILEDLAPHGLRPAEVEGPRYRFHCTVASRLSPEQLAAVRDDVGSRSAEFRFPARTLCLFCRRDPNDWIVCRRAALQGARFASHPRW